MRVLLIEDDKNLCSSIGFQLEQEGFSVDLCMDGEEGLWFVRERAHDLILLDRMLPHMSGIEILMTMRKEEIYTPVILLTALGELNDRVSGLDAGADDYIVKPFAFEELMARIRSISRRPRRLETDHVITFGDIQFHIREKKLVCGPATCSLSKKEADLLETFIKNPEQILTRGILISRVWGLDADIEEGNLDNYIHFLRRRLKTVKSRLVLKTIRGTGYRLEEPDV